MRNLGDGASPATTLRYYRSPDATIASDDTSVGTDAVSALAPSGLAEESIRLTAPLSAGIYYYGACIDRWPENPPGKTIAPALYLCS